MTNEQIKAIKTELRSEINALLEMIPDEEIEAILRVEQIARIVHAARRLGMIEGIKIIESAKQKP